MILLNTTMQGFKSYARPTTFSFDANPPGLYFLTGDNQVEPDLGANGTGKSSLWDGIYWCFFGKTPRNVAAGGIHTWYASESTKVTNTFVVGDDEFELTRTWSPNTLTLVTNDGTPEEAKQSEIEDILGLNSVSFLHSILIPQKSSDMFFDLLPTAKAELFGGILDLQCWLDYANLAKESVKQVDGFIRDSEQDLSRLQGQVLELEAQDYEEDITDWQLEQTTKKQGFERTISSSALRLAKAEKLVVKFEKQVDGLVAEKEELALTLEKAKDTFQTRQKVATALLTTQTILSTTLKPLIRQASKLSDQIEGGVDGTCPNCHQDLDCAVLQRELDLVAEQVTKTRQELKAAETACSEAEAAVSALRREQNQLEDDRDDVQVELSEAQADLNKNAADLKAAERDITRAKSDIKKLSSAKNPWLERQKDQADKLAMLQKQVVVSTEELDSSLADRATSYYWIKGFKDVRLFLIEEALVQFEIEVNNALDTLGMSDWRIEFAVDSENKSGTIKKGFSVLVQCPYTSEKVPWEAWSGGESQRLRLAGTMGLSSLIMQRRGLQSNLEIWDEPSQHLSEKGVSDLIETLHARARATNKQIWIVDHSALSFGGFTKTFVAVKDGSGTHIETIESE